MKLPSDMQERRCPRLGGGLAQWWEHPVVVFDPIALPLEVACAQAALLGERGVVVLAKRGPRGGWVQIRHMLPDQTPRRWRWDTAHAGEIRR